MPFLRKNLANQYVDTLIVCDDGVAQRQMLELLIIRKFPQIKIQKVDDSVSLTDNTLAASKLIITTVPLVVKAEFRSRVVEISSSFSDDDQHRIAKSIDRMTNDYLLGILSKDEIDFKFFKGEYASRCELLISMLQISEQFGYTTDDFAKSVLERENRASTAIGKKIAIPHGNDQYILRQSVFLYKKQCRNPMG